MPEQGAKAPFPWKRAHQLSAKSFFLFHFNVLFLY